MQVRLMMVTATLVFAGCIYAPEKLTAQAPKEVTNSIGMKLLLIPKGTFQMGSPKNEVGRWDKERQHEVTISQDYYLGAFEVTQAQYAKVMGNNPSHFQGDKVGNMDSTNHPVEMVSWDDAVEFCRRLSELPEEKAAERVYRLPTEGEWEYACRAGSETAYSFGDERDSLNDYAWYSSNSDSKTHPVGEKKPNALGLYDMHGNVWEWCSDWYGGDYPKGTVNDPSGPSEGSARVLRGGSWFYEAALCRSAVRNWINPSVHYLNFGFRLALSSPSGIP